MELYGVGNVVLHYREKKKLSQMQVCEGICNEMTMSRIETGEREFDSLLSETLLERLGKTTNRFEFVLNDEDYYYYILRENVIKAIDSGDLGSAKRYISDYRKAMSDTHVLHEQFVLYYEALIMKFENKSKKEIVNCLYKALHLTRSDFKDKTIRMRLYSAIEIRIIYELSIYEDYSYELLSSVFRFVDEVYDEEEKGKVLIPFLYNLGIKYEQDKNWYELEKISDKAIRLLQSGRSYLYMVEFDYMKVMAEQQLYRNTAHWDEKRIELIQRCNEIYYMSMAIEHDEMMKKAEDFCKEQLGCQITM